MRRVRSWKRVAAYAAVAAVVVAVGSRFRGADAKPTPRDADAPRSSSATVPPRRTWKPEVTSVRVRSQYEHTNRVVSRDIGLSVALPNGKALWIFGDTGVITRAPGAHWESVDFIDGSTAMVAPSRPGQVPRGMELPAGRPARFVPAPTSVYMPDGSGRRCAKPTPTAAFAARWPTGAALMPANHAQVIVTYLVVCVVQTVDGEPVHHTEGWGYLLYDWRSRQIEHGPVDVFAPRTNGGELPESLRFGWPVVTRGKLTLFSASCSRLLVACGGGHVWAATLVPEVGVLDDPASYDAEPVRTDGSARWQPMSISVGKYEDGLRLVEQTSVLGAYRIFEAPEVGAPWHLAGSGTLPGCRNPNGFCFGLEGHPELSTASSVFVSYKDPSSGPSGHVVVSALRG
jgi:hypothetical protein